MPEVTRKAGRKEWTALGVLMLALLLVSMDMSVVYFAVPNITEQLEPSATQQLWMFDAYSFVLASLYITMGSIGDRIGRRKLLMLGGLVFGVGSILAAYSQSSEMLIFARIFQAVGGATLEPTAMALLRAMFHDPKERTKAVAIFVGTLGTGVTAGPVLSGLLLAHFWWGSIFLINVPFMIMLLLTAPLLLPESRNPRAGKFDFLGSLFTIIGLFPLIYGIKEIAANGTNSVRLACIAVGVVSLIAFAIRQKASDHPMLDMSLLRRRAVSGAVITKLIGSFALIGFTVFTAQYLQSVQDRTPLNAALWSLVPSVGVAVIQPTTVAFLEKGVRRSSITAGCFAMALGGFAIMTQLSAGSPLWLMLVAMSLQAGGLVSVLGQCTDMLVANVSEEEAGSGTSVLETGSLLGGSLGMALLGSVGAYVYGKDVKEKLPSGLPKEAYHAAPDTLGGAIVAAEKLPGQTGQTVLKVARDAFTHGLNLAAVAAGAVVVLGMIFVTAALRKVPNAPQSDEEHESRVVAQQAPASWQTEVNSPAQAAMWADPGESQAY
ncbi:MFS transporter [Streptomyces sp. NPDC001817]|uniref:MFS transporter n=1 Tax=Streptomyces sp. NPDC001817 TaxID=3154398 RepID=UPI0033224129